MPSIVTLGSSYTNRVFYAQTRLTKPVTDRLKVVATSA